MKGGIKRKKNHSKARIILNTDKQKIPISAVDYKRTHYVILIFTGFIFALFSITGFVKADYLWGINFLYYLPLWFKIPVICIGILVTFPGVASAINRGIDNFFDLYIRNLTGKKTEIALTILLGLLTLFIFSYFNVTSLYHGARQAMYFIGIDWSVSDILKANEHANNKPLLLIYIVFIQKIFHKMLNLTPYWSLGIPAVLLGVAYVYLLVLFVKELSGTILNSCFLFIMLITQAIVYYFFGFANYYSPIPFVTLLYMYAGVRYINKSVNIWFPLIVGLSALFVHMGTWSIFPSMVFLVLALYKKRFAWLYNLFTFRNAKRSISTFISVIVLFYVFAIMGFVPDYLREAFVPLYSWEFIENGGLIKYIMNSINIVLLLSPLGFILSIALLFRIRSVSIQGDFLYFLLWLGVGGFLYIFSINPQEIFAWDGYGWGATGYVLLGSVLFLASDKYLLHYRYLSIIIIVHASLYFCAWITLNNDAYASVNYYLSNMYKKDKGQVGVCLEILNKNLRDTKSVRRLLSEMETKAVYSNDYFWLSRNYEYLNETASKETYFKKTIESLIHQENPHSSDYYVCHSILDLYDNEVKVIPENRPLMRLLYETLIKLNPEYCNSYISYADYLLATGDSEKAHVILLEAESLSESISRDDEFFLRTLMCVVNYNRNKPLGIIKNFNILTRLTQIPQENLPPNACIAAIIAYAQIGNPGKAKMMIRRFQNKKLLEELPLSEAWINSIQDKISIPLQLNEILNSGKMDDLKIFVDGIIQDNDSDCLVIRICRLLSSILEGDRLGQGKSGFNLEDEALSSFGRMLINKDYMAFFELVHRVSGLEDNLRNLPEFYGMMNLLVAESSNYFIAKGMSDSLACLGEKINCVMPTLPHGYYMRAIHQRYNRKFNSADSLMNYAGTLNIYYDRESEAELDSLLETLINSKR